jgi:DNA-binding NarL/FixJ family response regulator
MRLKCTKANFLGGVVLCQESIGFSDASAQYVCYFSGRRKVVSSGSWVRRVLIVEDDPITRTLLEVSLRGRDLEVACAASAAEARNLLNTFDPDIAIIDFDLGPGANGLDFATSASRTHPHLGLLFLSRSPELERKYQREGRLPQGSKFLSKLEFSNEEILINLLETWIKPQAIATGAQSLDPLILSRMQREVLKLVAAGLTNKEIAARRDTTARAVEKMLARIQERVPSLLLDSRSRRVSSAKVFLSQDG